MEALIKLKEMYANEDEERLSKTTEYLISNRCLQPKIWTQNVLNTVQKCPAYLHYQVILLVWFRLH